MSKFKWRDDSTGRGEPNVFSMNLGPMTIVVHRHIHFPGTWLLSIKKVVLFDKYDLETDDLEEAQVKAIELVREKAEEIYLCATRAEQSNT